MVGSYGCVFVPAIELIDASSNLAGFPRQPITTFQALSVDRLHGHPGLPFGDHDSQIAVTLGTGALKVCFATGLLNHDPDIYLGVQNFAQCAPVVSL
jgi:hypothetical protein